MMSKLSTILQFASLVLAAQSSSQIDLFPTKFPPFTQTDPPECATENIIEFFGATRGAATPMPTATGDLSMALFSWGNEFLKTITTAPPSGTPFPSYPLPDASFWCQFPSVAPSSVLPAWTTYISSASSWWSAHQSAATSLARMCPVDWYHGRWGIPSGDAKLNNLIAAAECADYEGGRFQSVTEEPLITPAPTPSSTKKTDAEEGTFTESMASPTTTIPPQEANAVGRRRAESAFMWLIGSAGFAVVLAVNSVL